MNHPPIKDCCSQKPAVRFLPNGLYIHCCKCRQTLRHVGSAVDAARIWDRIIEGCDKAQPLPSPKRRRRLKPI